MGLYTRILGDNGSGYEIGLKALQAVMKAHDKRGDQALLLKTVLDVLDLNNITQLLQWVYVNDFSKDKIANLAKTVCQTAEMNDRESLEILEHAAREIMMTIGSVINKLALENKTFDVVPTGSVFKCEISFRFLIINNLNKKYEGLNFINLEKEPVDGAVKLILEKIRD